METADRIELLTYWLRVSCSASWAISPPPSATKGFLIARHTGTICFYELDVFACSLNEFPVFESMEPIFTAPYACFEVVSRRASILRWIIPRPQSIPSWARISISHGHKLIKYIPGTPAWDMELVLPSPPPLFYLLRRTFLTVLTSHNTLRARKPRRCIKSHDLFLLFCRRHRPQSINLENAEVDYILPRVVDSLRKFVPAKQMRFVLTRQLHHSLSPNLLTMHYRYCKYWDCCYVWQTHRSC